MFFKQGHADAGFTFLEVMLAVTILATMAVLVVTSFSTTLNTVERLREDHQMEHEARTFHTIIADDLVGSHAHSRFPWIGRSEAQGGDPADVLAIVTASSSEDETSASTSAFVRVVYQLDNGQLVRWEMRNIYGVWNSVLVHSEVANDVVAFDLRYFDPVHNQWTDDWDSRSQNALPQAVMIKLTLRNALHRPEAYTQWLTIPGRG